MTKLILMDQFHIDFLVPSERSPRQIDATVRHIRRQKFLDDIRKAIRSAIRRRTALRHVLARVTR